MGWIPHAVHDGNHQNSIGCRFIDGEIASLYKQPGPFGDIRAGDTHFGMPGGKIEFIEEPIDKARPRPVRCPRQWFARFPAGRFAHAGSGDSQTREERSCFKPRRNSCRSMLSPSPLALPSA